MWTQSKLLQLDRTDVDLYASKHNSRRQKQTIFGGRYYHFDEFLVVTLIFVWDANVLEYFWVSLIL